MGGGIADVTTNPADMSRAETADTSHGGPALVGSRHPAIAQARVTNEQARAPIQSVSITSRTSRL
jgi:hypothetical protein